MENCLVTKLKGVVNNDNLPIFGKIEVKFLGNAETFPGVKLVVGMKSGQQCVITSKADALLDFNTKQSIPSRTCDQNFDGNNAVTTSLNGDILYVDNMYNINVLYLGTYNSYVSANALKLDFSQIKFLNLQRIHISGCFVDKQFDDFSFLEGSKDTLEKLEIDHNGVHWETVDLMYLTKFTHLTDIDSTATLYKPVDYKQFALGQIANGRTTGSINLMISSNNLFDGESISSGSYTLSWTSAEDITLSPR